MTRRSPLVLAILLLFVPAARAEFEIGGSIGQSHVKADTGGLDLDTDDTSWKIFLGWRFMRFFGVEGGYQDLGNPSVTLGASSTHADIRGLDAFAVGVLPIKKLELFAKLGLIYYEWKAQAYGAPDPNFDQDDSGLDVAYGLGVAWRFTPRIALRGEWERFDLQPVNDLWSFSVGVDFRF